MPLICNSTLEGRDLQHDIIMRYTDQDVGAASQISILTLKCHLTWDSAWFLKALKDVYSIVIKHVSVHYLNHTFPVIWRNWFFKIHRRALEILSQIPSFLQDNKLHLDACKTIYLIVKTFYTSNSFSFKLTWKPFFTLIYKSYTFSKYRNSKLSSILSYKLYTSSTE